MAEKKPKKEKGKVNEQIKSFEIKINKFGQLEKNMSAEELNVFLNKNLEDRKLNPSSEDNLPDETKSKD